MRKASSITRDGGWRTRLLPGIALLLGALAATPAMSAPQLLLNVQTVNAASTSSTFGLTLTGWSIASDSIAVVGSGVMPSSQNSPGIFGTTGAAATVTQSSVGAGWPTTLQTASCTDANAPGDGNASAATNLATLAGNTVTLPATAMKASALITCVLTNARATVSLAKSVVGIAPDGGLFNLTLGGSNLGTGGTNPALNVGNGGSTSSVGVDAGSALTLTETAGTGTSLSPYVSSVACRDAGGLSYTTGLGGSAGAFTVTAPPTTATGNAKNIACTITNTTLPAIALAMRSTGGIGTVGYTLSGVSNTSDSLMTTSPGVSVTSTTQHIAVVGTPATVTQAAVTGYTTAVSCVDANSANTGNTVPITSATGSVTIPAANLKASAAYTCTFSNAKLPTVTTTKVSTGPLNLAVGLFGYTGTNGVGGFTLLTALGGIPVSAATQTVTVGNTLTTLTESSVPLLWPANPAAVSCVDSNAAVSGNSAGTNYANLVGNAVTLAAAAMKDGASFGCTFFNTGFTSPSLSSTTAASANPLIVGASGQFYTVTVFTNRTTTAPILLRDTLPTGITLSGTPTLTAGTATGTLSGCPTSGGNTTGCSVATGVASGYFYVTLPVTVGATATSGTDTANLSGGGDTNCTTAADFCDSTTPATTIAAAPVINLYESTATASAGSATFGFTLTGLSVASDSIAVTGNTLVRSSQTITGTVGTAATLQQSTVPAGWRTVPSSVSCQDGNASVDGNPASTNLGTLSGSTVTLAAGVMRAGASISCTFSNRRPTVNLVNRIVGTPPDGGLFSLTVGGGSPGIDGTANPALNVGTGGGVSSLGVNAATALTMTEAAGTGTSLTNYTPTFACQDDHGTSYTTGTGGSAGNYTVTSPAAATSGGSEDITCTVTNSVLPRVTVTKQSIGGVGTFNYTLTGVANTTDTVTTATSGVTVTSPVVHQGTPSTLASVSETAVTGYSTTVSCADTNGAVTGNTTPLGSATGAVTLPAANMVAGAAYVCTFVNTRLPVVTATKTASANPLLVGIAGQFYDVAITVANNPTTAPITLSDSLPTGITASGLAVTLIPGTSSATAASLTGCAAATGSSTVSGCSVASGVSNGSFTLRIPVSVGTTAVGTTGGNNRANLGGGGDAACTAAGTTETCDPATAATAVAAPPTVALVKQSLGGIGTFAFTLSGVTNAADSVTTSVLGGLVASAVSHVGTAGVAAGVTETALAGYSTATSCVDLNSALTGNGTAIVSVNGIAAIPAGNMVNGAAYVCTFVNTRLPIVSLNKITIGGLGTGIFGFTGTNGLAPQAITTLLSGTLVGATPQFVAAANTLTTITESSVSLGWPTNPVSVSCLDANTAASGNVTTNLATLSANVATLPAGVMTPGAVIGCTFTNSLAAATLAVVKISLGGTGTFNFNGTNGVGAQAITTLTAGVPALGVPQLLSISGVPTVLSEGPLGTLGYALTSASCTGLGVGGNAVVDLVGGTVTLDAAATVLGTVAVCTLTNTKLPTLTATKTASANPLSIGVTGQYYDVTVTVANGPTTAPITLSDNLPTGITASGLAITLIPGTSSATAASLTGCVATAGSSTVSGCSVATGIGNGTFTIRIPIGVGTPAFGTTGGSNRANLGGGGDTTCTAAGTTETCDPATPDTAVTQSLFAAGRVFGDNGAGSGTANDGVVNGAEVGIMGITISLTRCASSTAIATALTDSAGNYTLAVPPATGVGNALCVQKTTAGGRVSTGASVGSTALPSGAVVSVAGIGYTYTRGGAPDVIAFTWNGIGHSNLNFGDVPFNAFAADGVKSGQAGNTVSYAHIFDAQTGGSVSFGIASSTAAPALGGWSERIFADAGCTGVLQAGAVQLYPPAAAGSAVVTGQQVCIVVQEFIPATAPNGYANTVKVTASFNYSNSNPVLSASITATDTTSVGASALALKKEVRNVTQGGAFGVYNLVKSGEVLEYRLTYINNGTSPATGLHAFDITPSYTTFVSAAEGTTPASLSNCQKQTPVNPAPAAIVACAVVQTVGGTGAVGFTLTGPFNPGATGTLLFRVKVD